MYTLYRCYYFIRPHPWVPIIQGIVTFFVLANFTLATFMDPGVIPKGITSKVLSYRCCDKATLIKYVVMFKHHLTKTEMMISVRRCTKPSK